MIHRQPFGSGTGSEITKLSGSSLGNISMFEGLKIPRAHALLHAAPSSSGSEVNLVIDHSDTLPSDYPSESHSEVGIEASRIFFCHRSIDTEKKNVNPIFLIKKKLRHFDPVPSRSNSYIG